MALRERSIELRQAQAHLAELVHEVAGGKEVVLTEDGEPVARIIPISRAKPGPCEFGSARGQISMSEDFDEPLKAPPALPPVSAPDGEAHLPATSPA